MKVVSRKGYGWRKSSLAGGFLFYLENKMNLFMKNHLGDNFSKLKTAKVLLIVVAVFLLLSYLIYKYAFNYYSRKVGVENVNNEEGSGNADQRKLLYCSRTTRLENDQKYDRALSLIYEKVSEGENQSVWASYNYFPAQLTNCIKIIPTNTARDNQAEGYFDPNSKEIKPDYFPVYIDFYSYNWADDLTTALLLTHEITHVQQHINLVNCYEEGKRIGDLGPDFLCKGVCINDEVAAFYSQLLFLGQLNDEEKKSINLRIENDAELHPQLETLGIIRKALQPGIIEGCEIYNHECILQRINQSLSLLIRESGAYDDQCGLR